MMKGKICRPFGLLCLLTALLLTNACSKAENPAAEQKAEPKDVSLDAAVLAATVSDEAPGAAVPEAPEAPVDEANLMRQWARNCALCHVRGEGGAPMIGDIDNWRERVIQGESVLLTHTIEGINNMPPLGYCMDCETQDFAALIRYMAGPALTETLDSEEASGT